MARRTNFLDGNDNFREQNLRFVRNEMEDNFNQFFGGSKNNNGGNAGINNAPNVAAPPRDSKVVQPTPGFCVKTFKVNSNEKFFINVCQAAEVPAPTDVTDEELIAILESSTPGSFRVPMSISELRNTKDRSDNSVEVCDIAVHPNFLAKIKKSQLFNNFFLQIVAEALSEKYNIQITMHKTIILSNRKFIGTLVAHRVRNDDVQRAVNSSDPGKPGLQASSGQQLVQEIDEAHATNIRNNWIKNREPVYKLRARLRDEVVHEIQAELYLPNCVSSQEFNLDIGEDRILLESLKHGILFDKFVNYRLNQERAQALFDKTSKMLQVRIPVHSA
ncbi:PIH1 domain-containing protein 1-like [Drosophila sulfurigaster albostrigata]|uniref:PIH1 domain-containing protein 1-like n=1 Tax=Drosophila sulfurigaster albostrigata TaxID=89887 RepID=UPI002D21E856|nr:PIH1 domain-containing protein 1-like [Drosophila sulfurigaster albostrigata]